MSGQKRLVVGLLSHYLEDANLGCVALSVSNMALMDEVAKQQGIDLEYRILLNEKAPAAAPTHSATPYEYRRFDSSKQTLRHPLRYWRSSVFDGCDLVVNINAGDGFTDLYSFNRMISESYMMLLAQRKKVATVMAPQTIGPFEKPASRAIARRVMSRCVTVFSRDRLSTQLAESLSARGNVVEVIDVAFALPFEKTPIEPLPGQALHVGINVSGLLYRGGYNGDNYFNLAIDYKAFIHALITEVQAQGHRVHLISHVIAEPGSVEDDYSACEEVAKHFPEVVVAPRFEDPIAVKNYIASLDFFSGARMHATIAAFSSGTPVVPIGYSKKLNGLYDTLDYPYYLDIRDSQWTVDGAVKQFLTWLDGRSELSSRLAERRPVFADRLEIYKNNLRSLMTAAARIH
ncbi:MAG TPA: polysaccharide pyruvyl transferase family protein [Nocardioides sp.]|uniref:polysaccharide pyruvyl transferase family protein n=1 Tax=Nocardioides sp. TaxID=35761 RepID=UPI002BA76D03|nr:polysaccharide pyruvyl transferase family protein [Nocardioides sp.]HTW17522.1 polysaccharide pyruvyl transferase family protein [Nocardioides sp.]